MKAHQIVLSICVAVALVLGLGSCLATTGDVNASRENTRDLVKKNVQETAKLAAGESTPAEYQSAMGKALGLSDADWDERAPEGRNWLALAIGPAAAAAVYGIRELQRRRDLKSVAETDKWVAEVEAKVSPTPKST